MLKNIPSILNPELLKILMEMGHGDERVIGDGNFPAASCAQRLVRLDGHSVPDVLDAILKLFPLDTYVDAPVALMDNGDSENRPPIWAEYEEIVKNNLNLLNALISMTEQKKLMQLFQQVKLQFMQMLLSKKV